MIDRTFDYALDRDDAIASVGDSWLEFARQNRASELTRELVVGRSVWSFVSGSETRILYEELFDGIRSRGRSVTVPFRCDSPDRFRFMRLVLESGPDDSIRCQGVLLREQERPFCSILDRAFPRSNARLSMCSLCKRVFAFQARWLELEDGIRELGLFDSADPPELRYVVCDDCASAGRLVPESPGVS